MKVFRIFFCVFFLLNCSKESKLETEEPITSIKELAFIKTFGGSKNDVLKSVVKSSNGGYTILGYTQSKDGDISTKNDESFDFWLLNYNANNSLNWSKTFGGSNDDRGSDIINTSDGGYAVLGYSRSSDKDVNLNAGSQDFWILKLTKNGIISWQKTFGFSGVDYGTTLTQTNDNGYLITGVLDVTSSGGQGNSKSAKTQHAGGDIWAIKLNASGKKEWSKYYGGSFTDTPLGVIKTSDNGFIIAGSSDSNDVDITNNKGSYDFWVIKISDDGSLVWEKNFGGSEIDEARGITATNDGNFIVVGDTRSSDVDISSNNGAADVLVLKISNEGNLIWEKTIGATGFDVARSVTKTKDNGFIISGSSRSSDNGFTNQGKNDALLLKINNQGNLEWKQTFGGSEIDFLYDAIELEDNSIIAVGESSSSNGDLSENKGFSDALILKIKKQ